MLRTKNDLPKATRQSVIGLLQKLLSCAIDLTLQSKQAHWNVKGSHFISLHELFDKVHESTEESVDLIAERIAQFGGYVEATCKVVAKNTSLPEYPLNIIDGDQHIEALSNSIAAYGKMIRHGIDQCMKCNDAGTADILTEVSRAMDKNLWFVESHLQENKETHRTLRGVA